MQHETPLIDWHTSIKDAIRIIEHSPYHTAMITGDLAVFLGGVSVTDLRRLLVSGVNEEDEVGAHPPKYAISLSREDLHDKERLEACLAEVRLSDVRYVPVVTPTNQIDEILSVDDLDNILGSVRSPSGGPESSIRVLVVGGAGYLGSVLTRKLLAKGYAVRVLDSFIYGRHAIEELLSNDRLEVVEGDMRNIRTTVSALEGVHSVVLLAAIVGDPASSARPSQTIETNVLAAQALATACKLQHIGRFVYASTCSVYGAGVGLMDENSPLNPVSLYARTKIASERMILEMADDYFRPTVLRMGTLYGYSPRMRFDLVVNTMAMKSFTDRKINVFGGKQWRPLLNVADAADVYVACLEANIKDVGNQVFNVGSDEQNYQIEEIARIVGASLDGVPIEREASSLDARDYRVSFAKVQAAVGFRPRQSIELSAREIYEKLDQGIIADPTEKIYYNHYFDSVEE